MQIKHFLLATVILLCLLLFWQVISYSLLLGKKENNGIQLHIIESKTDSVSATIKNQTVCIRLAETDDKKKTMQITVLTDSSQNLNYKLDSTLASGRSIDSGNKNLAYINANLQDSAYRINSGITQAVIDTQKSEYVSETSGQTIRQLNNEIAATDVARQQLGYDTPVVSIIEIMPLKSKDPDIASTRARDTKFFRVIVEVENKLCQDASCHIYFSDPDAIKVPLDHQDITDPDAEPTDPVLLSSKNNGQQKFYPRPHRLTKPGRYLGILMYHEDKSNPLAQKLSEEIQP